MVQTRNAAAVAADPIINAVVSPEASLVARDLLEMVLANSVALTPAWEATLQALLANVLMNDYLNWWNKAGQKELDAAKVAADRAINLNPDLALGYHARGLVRRAEGDPQAASDDFQHARTLDSSFARAHAQVGNQKARGGQPQYSHEDFATARKLAPSDPAIGYVDWGEGRAYFEEGKWALAINCLQQSVQELPTVWYNRCYLATAQNQSSDPATKAAAQQTIKDFINDPRFEPATFTLIKQLKPDQSAAPSSPAAARNSVLGFVQPLLP